jgi:hypothetical protein
MENLMFVSQQQQQEILSSPKRPNARPSGGEV